MWKFKPLSCTNNAMKALDELVSERGNPNGVHIAVYDIEEGHLVMACGDKSVVDKLSLNRDTVAQIRRANNARFAVLAYDFDSDTVSLLDAVPEMGPLCAILCCLIDMVMQGEGAPQGRPTPKRRRCAPRRPQTYDDDDDDDVFAENDPEEEDWFAQQNESNGTYEPIFSGILGNLSKL